jgi:hypothetical protein
MDHKGDEPTGFVQYPRFESKMLELLASREWEMDTADVLLQAFRTIDVEGKGYVEAVQIEELLTTKGTPFRPKEVEGQRAPHSAPTLTQVCLFCFYSLSQGRQGRIHQQHLL